MPQEDPAPLWHAACRDPGLSFSEESPAMVVEDLMSVDPVCVEPGTPALFALDLMIDQGVRHLPVVDACRCVVGVVSIDDLAAALPVPVSLHRRLEDRDRRDVCAVSVGEVMTFTPDTVLRSTPADEAAGQMALKGIGCLPVVDEQGRLQGLLSETDVLQAFAAVLRGTDDRGARRRKTPDELLVEALRGERERLARALGAQEAVRPSLAARRLGSLDEAIARAERGELRSCVRCKGTISANRLRALPGTTICSRCAREFEW
jgi:acetoin utilization protein AcuB